MNYAPGSFPGAPGWGGEPAPSAESVYFKSQCNHLLSGVLGQARIGRLSTSWRSELSAPPAAAPYADVSALALREVVEMPAALWEPGQAGGNWRAALDAWFAASRIVVTTGFVDTMRQHLRLTESSEGTLRSLLSGMAAPLNLGAPDPADIRGQFITGEFTDQLDNIRAQSTASYVAQRDWLTASYLAGLQAGGVEAPNWREWLRARAQGWSNSLLSRRVEIETGSVAPHHLERLPNYWLPGAT